MVRDKRIVFGAGWIDSIEVCRRRKFRYRCPNRKSTEFGHRSTKRPAFRCDKCTTEFDNDPEEELTVQVFTANYSRTFRPADWPFPVKALDSAYIGNAQQHAIRRLDATALRPVLEKHLVTGEPWWGTHVREDERIPGGHGVGLSKTRVGQQRFRDAMLDCTAKPAPLPARKRLEPWRQPTSTSTARILSMTSGEACLLRSDLHALFDRWLITIDPDTWSIQIAPELMRYPAWLHWMDNPSCCQKSCGHGTYTFRIMRRPLARHGKNTRWSATPSPARAGDPDGTSEAQPQTAPSVWGLSCRSCKPGWGRRLTAMNTRQAR